MNLFGGVDLEVQGFDADGGERGEFLGLQRDRLGHCCNDGEVRKSTGFEQECVQVLYGHAGVAEGHDATTTALSFPGVLGVFNSKEWFAVDQTKADRTRTRLASDFGSFRPGFATFSNSSGAFSAVKSSLKI